MKSRNSATEHLDHGTLTSSFRVQLFRMQQRLVQGMGLTNPLRPAILPPGQQAGQCGSRQQSGQTEPASEPVAERIGERRRAADQARPTPDSFPSKRTQSTR